MDFYTKFKWSLGLILVFGLVLSTNIIDKNSFERVSSSIKTMYNDRLVAHNLICQMADNVHRKELAIISNDPNFFEDENQGVNEHLTSLIKAFSKTKLISEENRVFSSLTSTCKELFALESDYPAGKAKNILMQQKLERIKTDLNHLREIQMEEGGRQLGMSERELKVVDMFTRIEIYILVGIAVLFQIILLYRPSKKTAID